MEQAADRENQLIAKEMYKRYYSEYRGGIPGERIPGWLREGYTRDSAEESLKNARTQFSGWLNKKRHQRFRLIKQHWHIMHYGRD